MDDYEGSKRKPLFLAGGVALALGVVCLLWLGLSGGPADVAGAVTLDNQPLAGAEIGFVGVEEGKETLMVTTTNDEGAYKLVPNTRAGVPAGRYKVTVRKMSLKDGTVPTGEKRDQARDKGLLVNTLPKVYEDQATTPFEVEVKPGSNTVDLPLKKHP